MEKMWLIMVELIADTEDAPAPSKIGFMNITTWGDSRDAAKLKIESYLQSFEWQVVSVERADLVDETLEYGEDIADMIERTRNNPNAIILGTFYSYKPN